MLNVTDKAAAVLHASLEAAQPEEDNVLRLTRSEEGLSLALDGERDGDQTITHDDRTVLAVDPSLAQELDGATMDVIETPEGERLVLKGD